MADETPSNAARPRRTTATSSFGASRREGHDSTAFYARFRAPEISDDSTLAAPELVDAVAGRVHIGDSRDMSVIPDNAVGLIVTSPPYFAGKAYEEALGEGHIPADYMEYLAMLRDVFAECRRVLEPGGRIVVNVANLGRRPFRSLAADVTDILQDDLGMLLRGEVVWLKQRGSSGNCAWGSYRSPSNPVLRDTTERLVIASKGRFDRAFNPSRRARLGLPSSATIPADEFLEATLDVWEIAPESATRVNHPAPFPVALVERCLQLFTFADDLVLDPFMGSGTTAVAASRLGRRWVGFDTDPAYVAIAESRVRDEGRRVEGVDVRSLHDIAEEMLRSAGCSSVDWTVRVAPGLDASGRAITADGRQVWFELAGGNTSVRPGLLRGDVLWRMLGRAAAIHAVVGEPVIVFTAARPERASGGVVLDRVLADQAAVKAVVDVSSASALDDLRRVL